MLAAKVEEEAVAAEGGRAAAAKGEDVPPMRRGRTAVTVGSIVGRRHANAFS
jgi:hypothetical protein